MRREELAICGLRSSAIAWRLAGRLILPFPYQQLGEKQEGETLTSEIEKKRKATMTSIVVIKNEKEQQSYIFFLM